MFFYFDRMLVAWFQWTARQFELFTPLRSNVFFGITYLLSALGAGISAMRFMYFFLAVQDGILLVFHIVAHVFFTWRYFVLISALEMRQRAGVVHGVRNRRIASRLGMLLILCILVAISVHMTREFPRMHPMFFGWLVSVNLITACLLSLEYMLCVEPINPEERKRRQLGW